MASESAASHAHGGAHAHHWEYSVYPFILSFGILFLVPLAFAALFIYKIPLMAIAFAGLGTPLVLWGIAGWVSEGISVKHLVPGISVAGLPVFIVSEIFIFLSIFSAYWAFRLMADVWPPAGTPVMPTMLPIFMTVVLVLSSVTIHVAEEKLEHGDVGGFKSWLILTIVLGLVFLGCTGYEYTHLISGGFVPGTNIFSTVFFTLTGFHASHVLVGACVFIAVLIPALAGKTNKPLTQCASIYWHFVDAIWFFVVSQVYFW
ncbi:MAG: heme-copper oxidase subunit III [Alphaproteobacteria bacterium]|nr:heme-copper oxidase subunit III [Alphaproteobacteria bacterium]